MVCKSINKTLIVLIILFPFLGIAAKPEEIKTGNIKLGISSVNITPDKPILMSGYGDREIPFTGVHDSLYANTFYFSAEKANCLLITMDLLESPTDVTDEVKCLIAVKTNILKQNIVLVAVRNHGGSSIEQVEPELNREYTEVLKNRLVELSEKVSKNPRPFLMRIGKGSCNLNINRRAEFSDKEVWLGKDPAGPCDHEVDVIRFESLDHKSLGIIVNWPCHGPVSGDTNYEVTGDWPGSAAEYIKNQLGNHVVVGVTAGASADINPIYGPGIDFAEVNAVGFHIGKDVIRVLSEINTYPVNSIQAVDTTLVFPGKMPSDNHFPQSLFERGPDTSIRLSVFKVGNIILAGISGELMTEIGLETEETVAIHGYRHFNPLQRFERLYLYRQFLSQSRLRNSGNPTNAWS